jgi:hypothetical protein
MGIHFSKDCLTTDATRVLNELQSKYNLTIKPEYADLFHQIFACDSIREQEYDVTNPDILYILGVYYQFGRANYVRAIHYYDMAFTTHNHVACVYHLAECHDKLQNSKQAIHYWLLAIQHHVLTQKAFDIIVVLMDWYPLTVSHEIYKITKESAPENKWIQVIQRRLTQNMKANTYNTKIKLFAKLNNITTCQKCWKTDLNIDLACGHEICVHCYPYTHHRCYLGCLLY